jgi:hypothetical protein
MQVCFKFLMIFELKFKTLFTLSIFDLDNLTLIYVKQ